MFDIEFKLDISQKNYIMLTFLSLLLKKQYIKVHGMIKIWGVKDRETSSEIV